MENTSPLPPNVPQRPSGAPTVHVAADSPERPDGWRDEYEDDPEYQRILARMETPWWKRPLALWGGVVAIAVASFFLGFSSGNSGGSDNNLTAAEKGKSDAQAIVQNHTARGDVSITDTSPELACGVAEKGVGFIRFYTADQEQEYLIACEQEFAALTRQ
ncbi:hypothetical protein [Streptomyces aurantiogriseus]|uniref:Uncharacterized protein n=1 Tax=Streptomyces aurantiogriseus TaxID=66870 RepID=A0A918CHH9_9ACTN|nr:hypothetical protein [Streptomyces aurantiogriseus]GGR24085.1 hypothetical protein GCM10010251_45200 [Streptomyces aurantiogriseus]